MNMYLGIPYTVLLVGCLGSFQQICANNHSCSRMCEKGKEKTCEFNFTIENYLVLAKIQDTCGKCPTNRADCFRSKCVSANGQSRGLITVNKQLPGPIIKVCKGDTVVVRVENKMVDGSTTSIHWHGIHQSNVSMDGVPGVTQRNIVPSQTFTYEFKADNAGTHWYHSMTGLQTGDGLYGAFIVQEPNGAAINKDMYDEDMADHVIIVAEWLQRSSTYRHLKYLYSKPDWPISGMSTLVNGRGVLLNNDDRNTRTPRSVFTVEKGKRYRFRVISAATTCWHRLMIDNHQMTMIASDGQSFRPKPVGIFELHPGERYDFILNASQPGNRQNYWIKLEQKGACTGNNSETHGAAVLSYSRSYNYDEEPTDNVTNFIHTGMIMTPQNLSDLEPLETQKNVPESDITHYIGIHYQVDGGIRFPTLNNDEPAVPTITKLNLGLSSSIDVRFKYSVKVGIHQYFQVRSSGISFHVSQRSMKFPAEPLISHWNESNICNDTNKQSKEDVHRCTYMVSIEKGKVVDLFVFSNAVEPFSMHLHGYSFWVIGMGMLPGKFKNNATMSSISEEDNDGHSFTRIESPVKKDTVVIMGYGYVILRFKADKPGLWLFQCQTEQLLLQGMAMLIQVGDKCQFLQEPSKQRLCKPNKGQIKSTDLSESNINYYAVILIPVITFITFFFIIAVMIIVGLLSGKPEKLNSIKAAFFECIQIIKTCKCKPTAEDGDLNMTELEALNNPS